MSESTIPSDNILVRYARFAVFSELKKRQSLKQPIAKFNPKTKKVYIVYGDGTTVFVGDAMKRGRYSEREKKLL